MTGVMATLKTYHALRMIGQPIDDLALAFITPLSADYHYVLSHYKTFNFEKSKRDNLPNAIAQNQFAIALQLPAQCRIAEQIHHHRLARRAQLCDLVAQHGGVERVPGQKFFVVRRAYA